MIPLECRVRELEVGLDACVIHPTVDQHDRGLEPVDLIDRFTENVVSNTPEEMILRGSVENLAHAHPSCRA